VLRQSACRGRHCESSQGATSLCINSSRNSTGESRCESRCKTANDGPLVPHAWLPTFADFLQRPSSCPPRGSGMSLIPHATSVCPENRFHGETSFKVRQNYAFSKKDSMYVVYISHQESWFGPGSWCGSTGEEGGGRKSCLGPRLARALISRRVLPLFTSQ
jgi:hypothetical protein